MSGVIESTLALTIEPTDVVANERRSECPHRERVDHQETADSRWIALRVMCISKPRNKVQKKSKCILSHPLSIRESENPKLGRLEIDGCTLKRTRRSWTEYGQSLRTACWPAVQAAIIAIKAWVKWSDSAGNLPLEKHDTWIVHKHEHAGRNNCRCDEPLLEEWPEGKSRFPAHWSSSYYNLIQKEYRTKLYNYLINIPWMSGSSPIIHCANAAYVVIVDKNSARSVRTYSGHIPYDTGISEFSPTLIYPNWVKKK